MSVRGQAIRAKYVAWNTLSNAYQSNDLANHTIFWHADGADTTPTNAAAAAGPGTYEVLLTVPETNHADGQIVGTSSTPGVVIIGTPYTFEPPSKNIGIDVKNIEVRD